MASMTVQQAYDLAATRHRAGQLAEAEDLYRQILTHAPDHSQSLHMLGVIYCQAGRFADGAALLQKVVALRPDHADALRDLGNALMAQGKTDEAIAVYFQATALRPDYFDIQLNLGAALLSRARYAEAVSACRAAVALKFDSPEAHSNMGNALVCSGQAREAIAACRQAIAINPQYATAYYNLANAHRDVREFSSAIVAYRQALSLQPGFLDAAVNLANVLTMAGRFDEAIDANRRIISLRPDFPDAHSNLGNVLMEIDQIEQAIDSYRRAIALKPEYPEAFSNLGNAFLAQGKPSAAIDAYRRAIALNPTLASAHSNLALMLMLRGEFDEGLREYEHRFATKDFPSLAGELSQPRWDGSDLPEGTILLHAEQGFGDTFQFIRYASMVARRCRKVLIMCQPEVFSVLQTLPGVAQWLVPGEALPAFNVHCPLMSLPLTLGTTLETIPAGVPYIDVEAGKVSQWARRLAAHSADFNVGIAWAGRPTHKRDRNRSLSLSDLALLGKVKGVAFHSLQKGDAASQAKCPPAGLKLIDWSDDLTDFSETAALIANLDLVISVDTAVVHLAGAMGKAVWTMLPFMPDFRWLLERGDTPWYPTMRLFRQSTLGDWKSVIAKVANELTRQTGGAPLV